MSLNLKEAQRNSLLKMINLNEAIDPSVELQTGWKVFIYDKFGQQIISPSMRLGELRNAGVTLHLNLFSERQPIPDVNAVYFVEPSQENIQMIGQDLKKRMYETYNINFTSTLSRALMEELATIAVMTNSAASISQIYDQNLNFICLDDNLFSVELQNSYQLIHDPTTPEIKIEEYVTYVTAAVFSVIGTMGRVPIIKCCKGSVAEHIGRKLESKLRDSLMNTRMNLFSEQMHQSRPVLVLMDRSRDLASMLAHSWTYATLFHDILDMKLNRVTALIEERGRKVPKTYDIDVTDSMWKKMAPLSLPEVAMDIEQETKSYEKTVNNVGIKDGVADVGTEALNSAIQALPELQQKKLVLDMHTALASSLLKSIVERELDQFITMEESITTITSQALLTLIQDAKKLPGDKIRLFLIYYLSNPDIPDADVTKFEQALRTAQCDVSPIQYAKNVKMYSKMTLATLELHGQNQKSSNIDYLGSFTSNLTKLTESLGSTGISEKLGNFVQGVKDMLPTKKELPVTQVVDAILEGRNNATCLEDYITLDPKSQQSSVNRGHNFKEAIVFMIGGGNYYEYLNLVEHFKRPGVETKKITYGATELLSAEAFLKQLSPLGID